MPIIGILASQGRSLSSYESIATVTVGSGGQSTIDFTSIPSTYTHLQVRANYICSSSGGTLRFRVGNGSIDTGSNYSYHSIYAEGTGNYVYTGAPNNDSGYGLIGDQLTYMRAMIVDFIDYKNTNKVKSMKMLQGGDNNSSGLIGMSSTAWHQTSAITNIQFFTQSGNFNEYSSFALYGIKGA